MLNFSWSRGHPGLLLELHFLALGGLGSRINSTGERGAVVRAKVAQQGLLYTSHSQPKTATCNLIANTPLK